MAVKVHNTRGMDDDRSSIQEEERIRIRIGSRDMENVMISEDIDFKDFLQVGVITTTHGIAGEVKVFPTTDDPSRYLELKQVWLDNGKTRREVSLEKVRFFKNLVIVKFKEITSLNEAELLRKATLWVSRENAVKLQENEYFIVDLISLRVISDEGEELGMVSDVLSTGANDVYVVSKEGEKDLLIPAIKACILKVDLDKKVMEVHLLPGLRESQ